MKKIIKGAFTKFQTACGKCGCEFEYEFNDILCDGATHELDVFCPDCGFYTPHCYEDGLPSSRKEVEPDKPEEMGEGWCAGCRGYFPKLFKRMDDENIYWLCEDCYKKNAGIFVGYYIEK